MRDATGRQITLGNRCAWAGGGNAKRLVVGKVTGWREQGRIVTLLTEKGKRKVWLHQSESFRIVIIEKGIDT